ncbi:MAG: hypothetical protein M1829_000387 [Trizodia sp. TS-e1964]|nr:MAG: hypothetical protein M1829_000387 [Trizodia sp. TS-e1964]
MTGFQPSFPPSLAASGTSYPLVNQALRSNSLAHSTFSVIRIHTAKCDDCNQRNKSTLQRCDTCGKQICHTCMYKRDGDGTHLMNEGDRGWTAERALVFESKPKEIMTHKKSGKKPKEKKNTKGRGGAKGKNSTINDQDDIEDEENAKGKETTRGYADDVQLYGSRTRNSAIRHPSFGHPHVGVLTGRVTKSKATKLSTTVVIARQETEGSYVAVGSKKPSTPKRKVDQQEIRVTAAEMRQSNNAITLLLEAAKILEGQQGGSDLYCPPSNLFPPKTRYQENHISTLDDLETEGGPLDISQPWLHDAQPSDMASVLFAAEYMSIDNFSDALVGEPFPKPLRVNESEVQSAMQDNGRVMVNPFGQAGASVRHPDEQATAGFEYSF